MPNKWRKSSRSGGGEFGQGNCVEVMKVEQGA
jgi:hypothetical protein